MFKRYSAEELFFSSVKVINPQYQGDPELDDAIWYANIGLGGEPLEYTYPTVLYFDGEKYMDLGNMERDIKEEDSKIGFSIRPIYQIDFKSPASNYCKGKFSRSGAYKAFNDHMREFDREYKKFKEERKNKQMQKNKNM